MGRERLDDAPDSARPMRSRRHALAVAAVLILAAGLRLGVAEAVAPVKPLGDELYYVLVAANLADGLGHVYGPNARALRPPAHPWLLSWVAEPERLIASAAGAGGVRRSVRLEGLAPLVRMQVVIGCLGVAATIWLGTVLFDRRLGLLAGLLVALDPTLIAYSHFLWSENLFALLVTAGMAALAANARGGRTALAVVAGLLFGAAALTREIALVAAGVGAAWRVVFAGTADRRRALAQAALVLVVAACVIAPWAARNQARFGRVLPISSVGWIAIGEGNALEGAQWLRPASPGRSAFRREVLAIEDEAQRIDFARRRTWAVIAADPLGWAATKLWLNLPLMLSPDAFQLYKLRNGSYGEVSAGTVAIVTAVSAAATVAVLVLAVVGIVTAGARRRALALLLVGAVLAVHVFANANSRFRLPWMPFLTIYAAHALRGGWRDLGTLALRWRVTAAAAAGFVLFVAASWFVVA